MTIETEYASWRRAYRVLWLVAGALLLHMLVGPPVRIVLLPLLHVDLSSATRESLAALHLLESVAAAAVALGALCLTPMAESRRSLRFLVLAALLTTVGAAHAAATGVELLGLQVRGLMFFMPSELRLAPWGETGLYAAQLIALVIGLSDVGFVTRSWLVLGAPVIIAALLGQVAFTLLGCGGPSALRVMCDPLTAQLRALPRLLPALSAGLVPLGSALLLLAVVERARSIWHVVLAPEPAEEAKTVLTPREPVNDESAFDHDTVETWSW